MRLLLSSTAIFLAAVAVGPAAAGVITVTDAPLGRTTFGGNDIVNWGTLGPSFTLLPNPFTTSSSGGVNLTVSQTIAPFERRDQGSGWNGNFTDGNILLWTQGDNAHPMTIVFNSLIKGVGFQINPDFGETTTFVDVFGAGNALFGSFSLTTNDRSQPSADFIGFTSNLTDISKITVSQGTRSDFAINQMSLITGPSALPVPEPSSLLLTSLALACLSLSRRTQR